MSPQGGYAAYRYGQPAGTAAAAYSDRYVGYLFLPKSEHFIVNNHIYICQNTLCIPYMSTARKTGTNILMNNCSVFFWKKSILSSLKHVMEHEKLNSVTVVEISNSSCLLNEWNIAFNNDSRVIWRWLGRIMGAQHAMFYIHCPCGCSVVWLRQKTQRFWVRLWGCGYGYVCHCEFCQF